ncbi:hypothetical protein E2I00_010529, partial [Balaenoptera physalus]
VTAAPVSFSIRSVMQKYLEDRGEVTFEKIFSQKLGEYGAAGLLTRECLGPRAGAGPFSKSAIEHVQGHLVRKQVPPDLFQPYIEEICQNLRGDVFQKFIESDKFTRFCQWKNVELNIHGPGPQGWARAGEARGVDPSTPRGWLWGWCRSPAGTAQGREAHGDGGPRAGPRQPAVTPLLPPSPQLTMNDFSVHRIIGRGGFGEVYGYAMKCLDKKRIKMKQGETLALNERIMLSLVSTGKGVAYDSSADWFSLGCMLFKLLRGHSPFRQHKTKDKHEIDRMTLTMRDVNRRLGCLGRGAQEVKESPFFRSLDWQMVFLQKYPPPLMPPRGEVNAADAFDIGSFDEEDTKGIKLLDSDQELYRNFPLTISERWQQEVAETVFDTINIETDRLEARKKTKNKQLGHEEDGQPLPDPVAAAVLLPVPQPARSVEETQIKERKCLLLKIRGGKQFVLQCDQLVQRVPKMKNKPRSPVVELSKVPLVQRGSANGL